MPETGGAISPTRWVRILSTPDSLVAKTMTKSIVKIPITNEATLDGVMCLHFFSFFRLC